jgi:hypothetical protein
LSFGYGEKDFTDLRFRFYYTWFQHVHRFYFLFSYGGINLISLYTPLTVYIQILCRCKFSFYIHICVDSWLDYYIRMEEINLDYLELFINIYVLLRSIISEFPEGLFNITDWLWWVSYMLISNLHPNSYFVSWKFMVLTTLPHYLIDRLQFIAIRKLNH